MLKSSVAIILLVFLLDFTKETIGCAQYRWEYRNIYQDLPGNAVYGGHDKNGNSMYVGRAWHNGVLWPAAIVPRRRTAWITYAGKTHYKDHYEVLTGGNFHWQMGYEGRVPNGAIEGPSKYWVGRVPHKNGLIVGKVSEKHRTCFFSYDEKEKDNHRYEVLVNRC